MRRIVAFAALLFLAACGSETSSEHSTTTDSFNDQSVKILPDDPELHDMPVKPMDTSHSDMPVIDTDTATVIPL